VQNRPFLEYCCNSISYVRASGQRQIMRSDEQTSEVTREQYVESAPAELARAVLGNCTYLLAISIELHEVISIVTGNQNMVVAKANQWVGAAMIFAPIDLRLLPVPSLDVISSILDIEQSPPDPTKAPRDTWHARR